MSQIAKVAGLLALAGTIVPPLMFLAQSISEGAMKVVMLLATVVWFVAAPSWLKGGD